jgi:hypothetical protein
MTFTPGEIIATLSGVAVVIAQVTTTFLLVTKARRDAQESREDRARNAASLQEHLATQDIKLVALHESTNGLSRRAEELAEALGKAKGIAQEKANPT